jgi:hypothetical protein
MFLSLKFIFSPHKRITFDIDYIYRKTGRGFIWVCQKPLMVIANFIDKSLQKIAGVSVWFSRNPVAATRMMIDTMGIVLLRPFNPVYKRYEDDLKEVKRRYPEEPVQRIAIGTGVLLTLIFFIFYLVIYLMYSFL